MLSAIGAGFLVNDRVLAPLLLVFLLVGAAGLLLSLRRHRRWPAIILHLVSSVIVLVFIFVAYDRALIWLGVAGLIAAAVCDVFLQRRPRSDAATAH